MEKSDIAGETTAATPAECHPMQVGSRLLNRVVAISTQNRIWSGLQADQETQEESMKAKRWIKMPISFAIIYSFSVTSVVIPSRNWQNK